MIRRWSRVVILLFAIIPAMPDAALACSCMMSGPPCQAAGTADAVFAGVVNAIDAVENDDPGRPYEPRLVRFTIEQAFVNAPTGQVELVTGRGGGDCGYQFIVGKRYLVYAWKREGSARMSTGICSRTRPLEEAKEDLAYLASRAQSSSGGRVYGRVNEWQRDPAERSPVDHGPMEGLTVTLRGINFARDAVTDKNGRYEFSGLPAGKMSVSPSVPFGFSTRYLEREFELKDVRSCNQQDFQIHHEARVSGSVVDAAGRPLSGIPVEAVAADLAGFGPERILQPMKTDERGVFQIDELPPGRYVFGVNLTKGWSRDTPGRAIYLPGTLTVSEATVIELKPGDRKEIGVLRLIER